MNGSPSSRSRLRTNGVIQPIIVRRLPAESGLARQRYQIIAGERRWRAAQRAGLQRVPVVVKDVDDADHRRQLEMALVENIQRENLNPIEEASAYQRLVDEFQLRQEDIATRVGKDRATVANVLRLLKLPEEVRGQIASGELSMGHARAILGLPGDGEQRQMAREVIARGLSVREAEALVKRAATTTAPPPSPPPQKDVHTRAAEDELRLALGTDVTIHRKRKGGRVEIAFAQRGRVAADLRVPDRAPLKGGCASPESVAPRRQRWRSNSLRQTPHARNCGANAADAARLRVRLEGVEMNEKRSG